MVATRTSAALGLSGSAPFSVFLKFKPMDSATTEFLDRFSELLGSTYREFLIIFKILFMYDV
jgi:hypothetical protein